MMQHTDLHSVSAITVFGDPTFTHGQSFDAGTDTTTNGVSIRFLKPRFISHANRSLPAQQAVTVLLFLTPMHPRLRAIATTEISTALLELIARLTERRFLPGVALL